MFVYPEEVENPTRHDHYMLWIIIAACTASFLITLLMGTRETALQFGYIPATAEGSRIITSMFVHGGFLHLLGNMFFFWMFGDNVEDVIGSLPFMTCHLLAGVASIRVYDLLHPGSTIPLVGASGAISGVAGMYIVFFPTAAADLVFYFRSWEFGRFRTRVAYALGAWFGMQLILVLLVERTSLGESVRIAFSAHVGGFIAGIVLGSLFLLLGYMKRYKCKSDNRSWLLGYAT